MTYLARKINRARWELKPFMTPEDIAADAVTGCLRTTGNALSLWRCDSIAGIEDVVLALASTMDHCDTIDIVLLSQDALQSAGFLVQESPGHTCVEELRHRHVDLVELTLARITHLAHCVAREVRTGGHCQRFRHKQVRDLLLEAIRQRRLSVADLPESLRQETEKHLHGDR